MEHGNAVAHQGWGRLHADELSPLATRDLRRVLIIEHDSELGELVKSYVGRLPADVTLLTDAGAGLTKALTGAYDVIIFDQAPPGAGGLDTFCRALRAHEIQAAVLVLSDATSEAERILALADDYVCKPVNRSELLARTKALLRRMQGRQARLRAVPIQAADLFIDPATRRVQAGGHEVKLTSKQYELLYLLASHADRVFTRAQLLSALCRSSHRGSEHAVSCHINRLRLKIEPHAHKPRYIVTVWGEGYKFAP